MFSVSPVSLLSKSDQVLAQLRGLIVDGGIPAGTPLVEDSLAKQFDVSRGPVRDALRQLETEGLVERQRRGVIVRGLTPEDIDEMYSLREVLEGFAIRLAMGRTTSASHWNRAVELVDAMRTAAKHDQLEDFGRADMEFHDQFFQNSGHSRLQQAWDGYRPMFMIMLGRRDANNSDLAPTAEVHAVLLDAVLGNDVDKAQFCLNDHLQGSRDRLLESIRLRDLSGR